MKFANQFFRVHFTHQPSNDQVPIRITIDDLFTAHEDEATRWAHRVLCDRFGPGHPWKVTDVTRETQQTVHTVAADIDIEYAYCPSCDFGHEPDVTTCPADFGENYHGFRSKITTHSERSDAGCLIIVKW